MDHSSLPSHPDFPALPAQAVDITPDTGCVDCPLAQTPGHRSCTSFRMTKTPVVPDSARIGMKNLRQMQGQPHRRAFDIDGIVGSYGDPWYYYNASRAVNFAFFSSWTVASVEGDLVTLVTTEEDARSVLFASWSETENVLGYFRINGFYSVTSTQPLDMLEFQYPSKAYSLKSKILQVTAASSLSITVRIDKDLSGLYGTFVPVDDGEDGFVDDPEAATAKIYHHGREAEQWTYVVDPHYFYGRRTQKEVASSSLPSDGVWELEEGVICPPESADPLHSPNWVLEGYADGAWTILHEDLRLHTSHARGTHLALKTTLPEGSVREIPTTDLIETYTRFRATYYAETTPEDSSCSVRGYDRCFHSRIDHSNSAGNYGATNGAGITPEGQHVYCSERVYEEYEYVDEFDWISQAPGSDGIPDRVNVTLHHPTGLEDYPAGTGRCIQYGYCNKHENTLNHTDSPEASFSIDRTMKVLLELWFSCDKRRIQKAVLTQGPTGSNVERIGAPGILWLNGFFGGLITPGGWHPQASMRGDNTWFPKKPRTVVDQDGNESLMAPGGLEEGYLLEYDEDAESMVIADDVVGSIPDSVAGFKVRRDPFSPEATVEQNLLEYIGAQVERDTGQIKARRGLSGTSVALPAETIVAPGFDLSITTKQNSFRATFEWDGNASSDGVLTILPYAQDDKATSLGTRTIHSVESLGDHKYRIVFESETKTFSRFSLGGLGTIGDSYDAIFSVMAGGGPCILPYERQGLFSWDGDKDTGSRHAGVSPLDCVVVDGHSFVVESVQPHYEGSVAETWGNKVIANKGGVGGFYELAVANDADGNPLLPIVVTAVKRTSDSAVVTVITTTERLPAAGQECWYDGDRKIYFASEDAGEYMEIKYTDSAGTDYTQYFTVIAAFTVNLGTAYDEWTSATTKTIYIGSDSATVVEGGYDDPPQGTVRVDETDDKIQLTFNIDDAPKDWRMVLSSDVEAPAPQDDWAVGGRYTSFGRNRDAVVVLVDAFYDGDYFTENSAAGETAEFMRSATVFLPKSDLVLNWTAKTTDSWAAVPEDKRWPNAASGKIRIDGTFLDTLSGVVCFQLPEIQMVDNRGFVPASILNKTQAVLDATQWCLTDMGGGFGIYSIDKSVWRSWGTYRNAWNGTTCVVDDYDSGYQHGLSGASANRFSWQSIDGYSECYLRVNSSSFGAPALICNLPDGVEIKEAWAEVNSTALTRSHLYYTAPVVDCEGNVTEPGENPEYEPDVSTENPEFTVLRFTSATDFEVIASVTAPRSGRCVVNITEIVQAMYDDRKSGAMGYGLIYSPIGIGDGDGTGLEAYIKNGLRRDAVVCTDSECYSAGDTAPEYYTFEYLNLIWDNVSFGRVAVKLDYKGLDKLGQIGPRFPSFADVT